MLYTGAVSTVALVVPVEMRGRRLDEALAAAVTDHSRALLQKLVRRGCVRVDGRIAKRSNVRVQGGERIVVELETPSARPGSGLRVVHEDEHVIVVDKPAGLLTHPNEKKATGTLADLLTDRFGRLPLTKGTDRPGIVHRLDRETSGLVVVARTAEAMDHLEQQFRERRVDKTYLAVVHGAPREADFEVDRPIASCDGVRDRLRLGSERDGKPAHTLFRLEERLGDFSLVACKPSSGRRHHL